MIRVSTTTTLKAPVTETLAFVSYHLNSGIDHMYLFFDDPDDDAIPLLKNNRLLSIFRCNDAHWAGIGIDSNSTIQLKQEHNATKAFNLARNSGIDWVIHFDHDELIFGPSSIKNFLGSLPDNIDVVRFPVMEAMPQKARYKNPYQDIRYFKIYNALASSLPDFSTPKPQVQKQDKIIRRWHLRRKISRILRASHVKYDLGKNFLHGHQMGKSAIHTSANVNYIDSHKPVPDTGCSLEVIVSDSYYILHYDCMGFDNWKNKWNSRVSGKHNFNTDKFSTHRMNMLKKFENKSSDEELIGLYNKMYKLSAYDKMVLRSTGLLKKIQHNPDIFKKFDT